MTTPILQLKSLGIDDLTKFEWVTAPPAEIILRALEGLVAADMIGEDGRLTVIGEQVAEWPVEVNIARMVGLIHVGVTFHAEYVIVIWLKRVQMRGRDIDNCCYDIRASKLDLMDIYLWIIEKL